MRLYSFVIVAALIASFCYIEATDVFPQLEVPAESSHFDKRSLSTGRWGLRPGKRSLAAGRWGLRPGKRSIVEPNAETPTIDELAFEVAGKLRDRFRKNVATGRWGLRPGKRSEPSSDLYVLLPDDSM